MEDQSKFTNVFYQLLVHLLNTIIILTQDPYSYGGDPWAISYFTIKNLNFRHRSQAATFSSSFSRAEEDSNNWFPTGFEPDSFRL